MSPTVFQDSLGFIEGPAWTAAGELALVSISQGCVYVLDGQSGRVKEKIHTGGGPNGLAVSGKDIYVAQNGGIFGASGQAKGGVQKISGGRIELLFSEYFTAPNDLCFGPDGRLYVTDPLTDKALTEEIQGRVVACDVATGRCETIIESRLFPNGIAYDPSGQFLYITQTYPRIIERFRLQDGKFIPDGTVCSPVNGRPDGLAIDSHGNLWVCTPGTGGIEVFASDGSALRRIEVGAGSMTTNCCFGGESGGELFITAAGLGQVLRLPAGVTGLPLYPRT